MLQLYPLKKLGVTIIYSNKITLLDVILRVRLYFHSKGCCKGFKPTKILMVLFTSQMYLNIMNDNMTDNERELNDEVWEEVQT